MSAVTTTASAAVKPAAAQQPAAPKEAKDNAVAFDFSLLLQDAESETPQAATQLDADVTEGLADRLAQDAAEPLPAVDGLPPVQEEDFGLLGQLATPNLGDASSAAPEEAVPLAEALGGGKAPALVAGLPRQGLLTAAMGVERPAQQAMALHTQAEVVESGLDVLSGLEGRRLGADATSPQDAAERAGRIVLDERWQLADSADISPPMARLANQVEQWAVQWLGVAAATPRGHTTGGAGNQADTAEWAHAQMLADGGSGLRLMEQAVQASQGSQQAGQQAAQEQLRQEDLRFWLQGQQQRAEVVLQRDGQSVRVQVLLQGQEAHVVLRSDQEDLRELLGAGLAQLSDMLAQQGLALAEASVQADAQASSDKEAAASLQALGRAQRGRISAALTAAQMQDLEGMLPAEQSGLGRLNLYV